eukprot:443182_1
MGNDIGSEVVPALTLLKNTEFENDANDEIVQSPIGKLKQRERLATYGFLRQYQHEMPPEDIIYTICIFLQLMDEWNDSVTHIYVKIDGNTISHSDHGMGQIGMGYIHAYGTDIVSFGESKFWDFQIITPIYNSSPAIILGIIDENDIEINIPDFTAYNCYGFGLSLRNYKVCHNGQLTYFPYMDSVYVTNGDFIRMELDLRNGKYGILRYIVGMDIDRKVGRNQYTAFDNIDINRKYKLCVALLVGQHGLKLVNGV